MRSILLTIIFTLFVSHVLAQANNPLFIVTVNDKRGFIDKTGKIVIEPQWSEAGDFSEGLAIVSSSKNNYLRGYIDETGKMLIPLKFDAAKNFSEGLAPVGFDDSKLENNDHKWGFINRAGKLVIKPVFQLAESFSEGLAVVSNDEKYGFIDKTGKVVIPLQFDDATSFSGGLACVRLRNNWGYIDSTGKFVIKPVYTDALMFSEGLAPVKTGGLLFAPGKRPNDLPAKKSPEKWIYIDKTGKAVISLPGNIERAGRFFEGLAVVIVKGENTYKSGYIDKTGSFVIAPQFSGAGNFSDGLALITNLDSSKSEYGFIDKSGKFVMSFDSLSEYATVQNFNNGLAAVQKGGNTFDNVQEAKFGYIDKTGKIIWEPTK